MLNTQIVLLPNTTKVVLLVLALLIANGVVQPDAMIPQLCNVIRVVKTEVLALVAVLI